MRSVSGLEKPAVQWTFVAIAFALIVVVMLSGVALTRMRAAIYCRCSIKDTSYTAIGSGGDPVVLSTTS